MVHTNHPISSKQRRAVGVFPDRRSAEQALHELRDSGFPMDRVSVVTRDADKHDEIAGADVRDHIGNKADEGAKIGAVSGGALGGLTGLLVGLGTLAIPGIGPIMLAGATATTLATTLAGGAIGAVSGGLLGALIGLGIPEERARVYHDRIARGGYLVIVDGTDADIARAEAILHQRGIEEYGVYDAPNAAPVVATTPSTVHATSPTVGRRSAVGFFSHAADAEHAIVDLRSVGFPLSQITLVANQFQHRDRFAGTDLRDRFEAMRLGIPAEQARLYNDRLGRGEYMVVVHGTEDELNRAAPILSRRGLQEWRLYDPMAVHSEVPVEAPRTAVAAPVATASRVSGFGQTHQAVGFFSRRQDAEQAIADLRRSGFPLAQVSLVAQRFEQREPFTGVTLHDRFDNSRFGFPEESARFFNNRIGRGDYLVVVHGTPEQLRQAETILKRARIDDFGLYDALGNTHELPDAQLINRTSVPTPSTPVAMASTPVATASGVNRVGMQRKRAIGVFSHRREAEAALTELRHAGFPMDRVSLIAKHAEGDDRLAGVDMHTQTGNKADEGAKAGAVTGGALGGLGGLLVGLGTLAIPGLGPVMLGGAAATALATTLTGGAIGAAAGGLTGALVGLGIPEDRARVYNDRVSRGDYLVMIDGTEAETHQAEAVLRRHNIHEWSLFDAADVDATRHPVSTDRLHPIVIPLTARVKPALNTPIPMSPSLIVGMKRGSSANLN